MKLVFLSNLLTPHQLPLADAFYKALGEEFLFLETIEYSEELPVGWKPTFSERPYVKSIHFWKNNTREIKRTILEAEALIFGSAPLSMVRERLKNGKLTFRYSERVYKKEPPRYQMPLRALKYFWQFGRHKNLYLLCASAYTSGDYARTRTFLNKAYKWGYFPEVKPYTDVPGLIAKKQPSSILWVGRFLKLKHPEAPIEVAKRLVADGYDFTLTMIGTGEELDRTKSLAESIGLSDRVQFLGAMKPEEVRNHMEKSEIYLFTSDRGEGWGAVLNESMNSACAVVASHAIGAVPFLVKDGENGLIYKDGSIDDLYRKVKWLLDHPTERAQIGEAAYRTMAEEWNAENAAKKFLALAKAILDGNRPPNLFPDGVCSKANNLYDGWYKNETRMATEK